MDNERRITPEQLAYSLVWSDEKLAELERSGALPQYDFEDPKAWRPETIRRWLDARAKSAMTGFASRAAGNVLSRNDNIRAAVRTTTVAAPERN